MISLRDIQMVELEILDEIDRICKKNNIDYFLDSGTALGAIRHKGFIPWDDDIDIGMLRSDYDKFINIAAQQMNSKFFLQTKDTDFCYNKLHAKIRRNNTLFIEHAVKDIDMHQGIFVDVFPFDNVPDNKIVRKLHDWKCGIYKRMHSLKKMKFSDVMGWKKLLWCILKKIKEEELIYRFEKNIKKNNDKNTRYVTCFLYKMAYKKNIHFNRDWMSPVINIEFEGKKYFIMNSYDDYLKHMYGDFMCLPSEKDRKSHLPEVIKIFDKGE